MRPQLQTICFKPVKDAPNECLLVIMEQTSMQWMPQWVQVMMINKYGSPPLLLHDPTASMAHPSIAPRH
jgi:hypothetical protein